MSQLDIMKKRLSDLQWNKDVELKTKTPSQRYIDDLDLSIKRLTEYINSTEENLSRFNTPYQIVGK